MKIVDYLKDKIFYIILNIVVISLVVIILFLFESNKMLIFLILTLLFTSFLIPLIYEYIKKRLFYNLFRDRLEKLDKKYLITEMIKDSEFLDGRLLLDYLYEIDKSMHEEINVYKYRSIEFREYLELWCHEIKTPIATSKLIVDNNNSKITKSILEEINNIEDYVEQMLYYSRSDNVEKDYLINEVDLNEIVNNVVLKNKKDFINKHIKIDICSLNHVKSDSKWLDFIINQIIVNSIKYSALKNGKIKVYSKSNKNNVILYIEDNGIGISEIELGRVFDKGFTGENGRNNHSSTGIGLYLCKKLCVKLGHEINIESKKNEYTIVSIIFPNNSMTSNLTEM